MPDEPGGMNRSFDMKKIILAALAAGSALVSTAASAQSTSGEVHITGTVADKCVVTATGTPPAGSFGGSVSLGALDAADGKLKNSATLASSFAAAGASHLSYRVVCTTPKTTVTVNADDLVNTTATVSDGYANTVHYKANVALTMVGGNEALSNDSKDVPAGSSSTYTKRMSTAGGSNISVTADTFRTPDLNDVMLAGTYNGKITITLAPAN
jgi:type 1 fimbria pilin